MLVWPSSPGPTASQAMEGRKRRSNQLKVPALPASHGRVPSMAMLPTDSTSAAACPHTSELQ